MPDIHFPIATSGLLAFVAAVAVTDLRSRRIPNMLTVPAAAAGVTAAFVAHGGSGVLESVVGLLAGLAAFLPFYLARGFGAGDVKAMAAVGAFLGPKGALLAAAWTLVAGAIGGAFVIVAVGGLPSAQSLLRRWLLRASLLCTTGQAPTIEAPAGDAALRRFPYGAAIACGTIAALCWT